MSAPVDAPSAIPGDVQEQILRAVAGITYGSVEIVVHGAKVVQIEVREKLRFTEYQNKK